MWEVLTGKVPWSGNNPMHVVYQVACNHRRPPVPSPLPSKTPIKFVDLMNRCWAQDAEARPQFGAIVNELVVILAEVVAQSADSKETHHAEAKVTQVL